MEQEGDVLEPLCCSLTEGFSDDGGAGLVSARVWLGSLLMAELPEAQIDTKCNAKCMRCRWLLALSRGRVGVASWMTVVRCGRALLPQTAIDTAGAIEMKMEVAVVTGVGLRRCAR
jgi:hypothetical protein